MFGPKHQRVVWKMRPNYFQEHPVEALICIWLGILIYFWELKLIKHPFEAYAPQEFRSVLMLTGRFDCQFKWQCKNKTAQLECILSDTLISTPYNKGWLGELYL